MGRRQARPAGEELLAQRAFRIGGRVEAPPLQLGHDVTTSANVPGVITLVMLKPSTSLSAAQRSSSSATVAPEPAISGVSTPMPLRSTKSRSVHSPVPNVCTADLRYSLSVSSTGSSRPNCERSLPSQPDHRTSVPSASR
jgi:hypothetical protein